MKKSIFSLTIIILIFAIIFLLFSIVSYKQKYMQSQTTISKLQKEVYILAKRYPIDKRLEECTSTHFMTYDMNNCTYYAIKDWNNEITKYSKQITKYLDNNTAILFNDTQKVWENYYKIEKKFLNNTIAKKDGDIHTTFVANHLYELTKHRALLLKYTLKEIKD